MLFAESKALAGGMIPFPGQGGSGGLVPVYSSWDSWDSAIDMRYGMGSSKAVNYQAKIGDLAQNSLLVSAIRWLSNVLPEAPLQIKKSKGPEGPDDDEVVWDHPMLRLWNRPNQYYSGSTLMKAIAFSWVLRSEAYLIKFMNNAGTEPWELWYEPHWTIRPVWPINGTEFISHYEVNRDGRWYPLPVENVIHLRDGLNPYNQRFGFNGVPSVLPELYGDAQAAEYYATLMGGGAVPPWMVSLDSGMSGVDQKFIDGLTADLVRKTSGKRRGQPVVLKGGKAYKLGFNPKEMDLRESRYMAEDRFCAVMGIPAVVLELGSGQAHSIYNNVKQAEARAWNQYVKPLLNHIEEEFNVQLLEDWEGENSLSYVTHDYSKVQALQEDEDAKAKRVGGMYTDGIIMRSEARSMLNLGASDPANEDADKVFKIKTMDNLLKPGEDIPVRLSETTGPGAPTPGQPTLPPAPGEPANNGNKQPAPATT